jgi:hypothetical protein
MTDEEFLKPRVRARVPYEPDEPDEPDDIEIVSDTIVSDIKNVLDQSDSPATSPATNPATSPATNPIIYDKNTIFQVVHSSNSDEDRLRSYCRISTMLFKNFANISGRLNRELYVTAIMEIIVGYLDVINTANNYKLLICIKGKLDEFISKERMYTLIPIYNRIFTDNLYKSIQTQPKTDILTDQEISDYVDQYQKKLIEFHEHRNALRTLPVYEKDEIIGAKDKEGNWWMSRVLDTVSRDQHNMYYVEFLGWGDQFNEFIVDTYRLKRYNPRAHPYYRPAWKRKMNRELSEKEKLIADKIAKKQMSKSSLKKQVNNNMLPL